MLRTLASTTRRAMIGNNSRAVRTQQAPALTSSALRFIHSSPPTSFATKTEEEPLPPSIMEKFQLGEPSRFVPLTIAGFTAAWSTGLYHFDAETQLLTLWVLFCGTVYSQGGPAIAAMLDEVRDDIRKEHSRIEDAEIEAVKEAIIAHKRQTGIFGDMEALLGAQQSLLDDLVASSKNQMHKAIQKGAMDRLDMLIAAETQARDKLTKHLATSATQSVEAAFGEKGDAKLKSAALENAISALANPATAKKDASVPALYTKYLTDYEKRRAALVGKTIELSDEDYAVVKESVESFARRMDYEGPVNVERKFKFE